MEHKEDYIIPGITATKVVAMECEICGVIIKDWNKHEGWTNDKREVKVTDISAEIGKKNPYDGGGSTVKYVLDICGDCFITKLIPWFKEQGGTVREREIEW